MSQEQGLDGDVQGPGSAPAPPWSAPDATGDRGQAPSVAGPGVPPPAVRPPEPVYRVQPDGIPLRPLGIGELLDGTFSTIRRNPRATVGLAALLITLQQAVSLVAQLVTNGLPTFSGFQDETLSVQTVLGGFGGVVGTLLAAVVGAVLTGMLVVVVSEDVLGRRVSAADVWRRIRPRMWALLLAAAIAGIVPYVGLALLIVPGLLLWAAWSLTTPALVLEGIGPFAALRRSWRLAWPGLARVWWVRTLSVLMGFLIQFLIAVPFSAAGALTVAVTGGDDDPGTAVTVVVLALTVLGGIAAGMITAPFLAGVLALLYIDRRMRAEGLDLVLRRQERIRGSWRSARPGTGAPPGGSP
jgi:hypothetical protein